MGFLTAEEAINEIKAGRIVIVTDDQNRENEGDFVMAAEKATPESINFMAKHGRGLVCAPMAEERLQELQLPLMVFDNSALHGTKFTVSVDYLIGTTTGISAFDRSETIKALANPEAKPQDFGRPGHIFPLKSVNGGVLHRVGHTEATVDLARLAGLKPVGVLCEIMDDDGTMARMPKLLELAETFNMGILTIETLIEHRQKTEKLIENTLVTELPTKYGKFMLHLYHSLTENEHHLALVKGEITPDEPTIVRVHSQCLTGDILGSLRCDCGDQLGAALQMIEKEGKGILLYMRQEGRGIGLANKLKAYVLQDNGMDTVEANEHLGFKADQRDYGIGAQILVDLGVRKMRLLTNNPKKLVGLDGYGLDIVEQIPIKGAVHEYNERYLNTKKEKLNHML